jgi:hypothetical protein
MKRRRRGLDGARRAVVELHIAGADIGAPRLGIVGVEVLLDGLLQYAASGEDEVDRVATGSEAAGERRNVVRDPLDLLTSIGGRDGQANFTQDGQIDNVVSDVGDLVQRAGFILEDLVDRIHLVRLALIDVIDLEVASADRHGLRLALGDEAKLQSCQSRERNSKTIMGVKAFDFCAFAVGTGHDSNVAVGKNSIDVVEEDFDAIGAVYCRENLSGHEENDTAASAVSARR